MKTRVVVATLAVLALAAVIWLFVLPRGGLFGKVRVNPEIFAVCGNGSLDAGEQCDPSACVSGSDGVFCGSDQPCGPGELCSPSACECAPAPEVVCGNGILDVGWGEECDSTACSEGTWGVYCGGETVCDPGELCSPTSCECVPAETATCGNGVLEPGEQCDPSACVSGSDGVFCGSTEACGTGESCSASCECAPAETGTCGNGVLEPGEQCDPSACVSGSDGVFCGSDQTCGAASTCSPATCECVAESRESAEAVCGDGVLTGDEKCELDTDCRQGYFCGDPGTRAPCVCVLNAPPGANKPEDEGSEGEDPCEGAAKVETYDVYDCTYQGGTTFVHYSGVSCWDENGNLIFGGRTGGPYTVDHWIPFCPGVPEPGGDGGGDGGQQPPACDPFRQQCP